MPTTTSTTPEPPDAPSASTEAPTGEAPSTGRTAKHVAGPTTARREGGEPPAAEPSGRAGWWVLLLLGVLTVFYGLLVMSLRPAALASIAVFAGIGFIVSGIAQFMIAGEIGGGLRWVAYAGGTLAVVAGFAAFFWPGPTLLVLAVLTAWTFVVSGVTRIVGTLLGTRRGLWWPGLVLGLFELLLGLWAIGSPVRELLLFVNLIGIFLVVSGVDAIIVAAAGKTRARAGTAE